MKTLHTNRLLLRAPVEEDQASIFAIRTDESVNKFIDRPLPQSMDEAAAFIRKVSASCEEGKSYYWAITLKETNAFIGTICIWNLSEDRQSAETGYEMLPSFQGNGYMSEALEVVIRFAFDSAGINTLEAWTHKDNTASTALLLKQGFVLQQSREDPENKDHLIYKLDTNKTV